MFNISLLALLAMSWFSGGEKITTEDYIQRYSAEAIRNMQLSGVPASITLAQGILESGSGNSLLAREANNHFGIKCHKGWEGPTFTMDDDERDECFRKYEQVLDSYRDHATFLTSRDRYKGLFQLDPTDYKGWAHGLKAAGYATNPNYANLLIGLIERYELHAFDQVALGTNVPKETSPVVETPKDAEISPKEESVPAASAPPVPTRKPGRKPVKPAQQPTPPVTPPVTPVATSPAPSVAPVSSTPAAEKSSPSSAIRRSFYVNGLRVIQLERAVTKTELAREYDISVKRLELFNEWGPGDQPQAGQIVFLEPKRNAAVKGTDIHIVKEGDTWYSIAHAYGIRLAALLKKNKASHATMLIPGQEIQLRYDLKVVPPDFRGGPARN